MMRRFTANSIVVALLALLLAPAALLSDSQKLCCRRAGMHHCEGTSGAVPDRDQPSLNSNGAKCPMTGCAISAHAKFAAPRFQASFYHHYATQVSTSQQVDFCSDLRASNLRDRSPPSLS
jgi:hypothetical protein